MPDTEPLTVGSRPPIAEPIRQAIIDAFRVVPDGKRGALLAIVDESGARLHLAFTHRAALAGGWGYREAVRGEAVWVRGDRSQLVNRRD